MFSLRLWLLAPLCVSLMAGCGGGDAPLKKESKVESGRAAAPGTMVLLPSVPIGAPPLRPPADNLLRNGGFTETNAAGRPADWIVTEGPADGLRVTRDAVPAGTAAMEADPGDGPMMVGQTFESGSRTCYLARALTWSPDPAAAVALVAEDGDEVAGNWTVADNTPGNPDSWTQRTLFFSPPRPLAKVRVGARGEGGPFLATGMECWRFETKSTLKNGDFEKTAEDGKTPAWTSTGIARSTEAFEGSYAIELKMDAAKDTIVEYPAANGPALAGNFAAAHAMVKADGDAAKSGVTWEIVCIPPKGDAVVFSTPYGGSGQWEDLVVCGQIPAKLKADGVTVQLRLTRKANVAGTVLMDDAALFTVPPTGAPVAGK